MTNLSLRVQAALWWLLPLAALAAAIGWETDWGNAFDRRPQPAAPLAPKPVVTSLLPDYAIPGGAAARGEMVERTLFNPTRRPAPALAQGGNVGQLKRGQFALTGTTVIDGRSTAFLREVSTNKAQRVRAGEKINGMLVTEVKSDRVKLTLGDESEELVLKVATNPHPTKPPAAVAQTAAPASPVAPVAAIPPAPPGTPNAAQTLAERRRAARAAAGVTPPAPPPAAAPAPAPAAPTGAVDPRWQQMDQAYRERAASGVPGTPR